MKKILYIFCVGLISVMAISCSNFLDVNTDPNNASSSTPSLTFPAAVASSAGQLGSYYNILGGFWVQYWTQDNGSNQYKNIDAYNIQQSTFDSNFQELFSGALEDFQYVRDKSKASGDWNLYLMATVMQAYNFQMLADLYDQVPYSEALKGGSNLNPHYLSGDKIYDSLIIKIDEALSKDFSAKTVTNPEGSDFLYGGDINKWKQFANTLKLKIYLRQIYTRPDIAVNGIKALYTSGAKFLEKDAAMTQFIDQENKSNPLFETDQRKLNTTNNIRGSKTFIDFLIANGDPRIDKLFVPGSSGQKGLEQGNFGVPTNVINPASISKALIKPTDPVYFMTADESLFLQAEAVARGLGAGNDQELYDMGVKASFTRLKVTAPDTSFTKTGKVYAYPTGADFETRFKAIATQKWIALAGIEGIEAFFERNRTSYPRYSSTDYNEPGHVLGELVYPLGGVTGQGKFPKRLLFPESERNTNSNIPAQVDFTVKVWWDKNSNSDL